MKRLIVAVVFALSVAALVFGAENYLVQNVTGRVERQVTGDRWEEVKAGDSFSAETVVRTGVNSSLTLKAGSQSFNIGAVKSGKLAALTGSGGGIRIEGKVAQTDTGAADRTTGRISTAAARASDAAAEEDIAAE